MRLCRLWSSRKGSQRVKTVMMFVNLQAIEILGDKAAIVGLVLVLMHYLAHTNHKI